MLALSFRSPSGAAEIDLLVSESDNFDGLKSQALQIQVGGRTYYVASIDDLIAMKQKSGRPQDLLDIQTLQKLQQQAEE